jgi:hypothetical protein
LLTITIYNATKYKIPDDVNAADELLDCIVGDLDGIITVEALLLIAATEISNGVIIAIKL